MSLRWLPLTLLVVAACDLRPLSEHGPDAGDAAVDAPAPGDGSSPTETGQPEAGTDDGGAPDQKPSADGGGCPGQPTSETADPTTMTGWYSSIAVDPSSGAIHISHHNGSTQDALYATRPAGGTWQQETIQSTGQTGLYTALGRDPSTGRLHVVYFDLTDSALKHAWRDSGPWSAPKTVTDTGVGGNDLAVDSAGDVHLVTYGKMSTEVQYLRYTGAAWTAPVTLESAASTAGPKPGLALAPGNPPTVHVSLTSMAGELKHLSGQGGVFGTANALDSGLGHYSNSDIAVDGQGNAHICYLDSETRELRYVGQQAGVFGQPKTLASVGGVASLANAIVATSSGDLWVAYYNGNASGLQVVRRQGGSWGQAVDANYGGGRYLAAALGPGGELHVSHWKVTSNKLTHTRICP